MHTGRFSFLLKCAVAALLAVALAAPAQARKAVRKPSARTAAAASEYDQAQVSVGGEFRGAVRIYSTKGKLFVDARTAAKLMGGSAAFAGGRLELKFKNLKLSMRSGSREVRYNGKSKILDAPLLARKGVPFAPVEAFTADEFGSALDRLVSYNETAKSLDMDKRYQVGELDYYSYGLMTTVSFELHDVSQYTTMQTVPSRLDIMIPNATAQTYETVALNDGIINSVTVAHDGNGVKISLALSDDGVSWNTARDGGALTIQVTRSETAAQQQAAAPEPAPPVKVDTATVEAVKPDGAQAVSQPGLTSAEVQQKLRIPDAIVLSASDGKRHIVIDAGHGGKDPGATARRSVAEKHLNLAVAREVAALFRDNKYFDALLTRSTDFFIPLNGRCSIANNINADIFISIHTNAAGSNRRRTSERGFEVYFMSETAKDPWAKEVAEFENSVQGLEDNSVPTEGLLLHELARTEYMNESAYLAGFIANAMDKTSPMSNRGVKQAPFYVLRGTYAPAVLVEMGFINNTKDSVLLNQKATQKKIARGIYDGVISYARYKGWVPDK